MELSVIWALDNVLGKQPQAWYVWGRALPPLHTHNDVAEGLE